MLKKKALVAIGLGLLLCSCSPAYDKGDQYNVGNSVFNSDTVNKIDIDWTAGEVYITPTTSGQISVYEEIDNEATDEQKLHYYLDEFKTLNIKYAAANVKKAIETLRLKKLCIEIPMNIFLTELDIETVSAKTTVSTLNNFNKVDIQSVSGDIKVTGTKAGELDVESVSGNIVIQNVKVIDLENSSTSGNIKGQVITATNIEAENTSGLIDYQIDGDTISNIDIDSVSGDISIKLKETMGYTLKYETISGTFDTNFDKNIVNGTYVIGSGRIDIDIDTTSANLTIKK